MQRFNLYQGNCLDLLKTLPDSSIDSIVTDPPYGLSKEPDMAEVLTRWLAGDDYQHRGGGFMGKTWDSFVPGPSVWRECLRVLKPGGHLLAFFGSRTYDLGTTAIRLAGFEVRDQIQWIYAGGFPKNMDMAKAIVKATGEEETAAQWAGWGTALKPAHEPICLARKPFRGTVTANVLAQGAGALHIDACRVPFVDEADERESKGKNKHGDFQTDTPVTVNTYGKYNRLQENYDPTGRWPANVVHDGSDEVLALFPSSSVTGKRSATSQTQPVAGTTWLNSNHKSREYTDSGSTARFFYCAKASPRDRHEGLDDPGPQFAHGSTLRMIENQTKAKKGNHHPTVKPTALMAWLCRMVTPPGGVVLDPFMGSGSTGKAAMLEGFHFIGIDSEPEYVEIARRRITHALETAS